MVISSCGSLGQMRGVKVRDASKFPRWVISEVRAQIQALWFINYMMPKSLGARKPVFGSRMLYKDEWMSRMIEV